MQVAANSGGWVVDFDLQLVSAAIDEQGTTILKYGAALLAVGTLAMALLELFKGLIKARRMYNRWAVREWTAGRARVLRTMLASSARSEENKISAAQLELELLSAGGHDYADALYDQPVEKLMGQVQAAVHVAMDFPDHYPALYTFITALPAGSEHSAAGAAARQDAQAWRVGAPTLRAARQAAAVEPELPPRLDAQAADASQARARLMHLVERRLDAFQVETQYFWERLNQWGGVLVGTGVFYAGVLAASGDAASLGQHLTALLVALPAGIITPFAKDLTSNLASFRK